MAEQDANLRVSGAGILKNVMHCASVGGQGDVALLGGGTAVSSDVEMELVKQQRRGIDQGIIQTQKDLWKWTREAVHHVLEIKRSGMVEKLASYGDGQARSAYAAALVADLALEHRRRSADPENGEDAATEAPVGHGEE